MLQAIRYETGTLHLLDQTKLPGETTWIACKTVEDTARAIETMVVRGAPAIGCTAAYGAALCISRQENTATWANIRSPFQAALDRLSKTRPTAVNLFYAIDAMKKISFDDTATKSEILTKVEQLANELFDDDVRTCKAMGEHGADIFRDQGPKRALTHCNAGALATAAYGTAVGVLRSLHARGQIEHVYADETRPWLQGSRLTAYELAHENMPHQVIVEGTAAFLMQQGKIDFVVTGADRIAANGDTANKIGTYSLAVNAKHHGIPFYVAAPLSTFDLNAASLKEIPIEEREATEIVEMGNRQLAPKGTKVYNPSFDLTPNSLITGIITEIGVLRPSYVESISAAFNRT